MIDKVAYYSGGWKSTSGVAPDAPVISVAVLDTTATVSITGDAGVTHYVRYKKTTETDWTDGGSRVGDGILNIENLEKGNAYIFTVHSDSAEGSHSSSAAAVQSLPAAESNEYNDLLDDGADILLAEFGETIKYLPRAGGERQILAIIDYGQVEKLGSSLRGTGQKCVISVKNDALTGITSTEVDTGGDMAELPWPDIGDAVQKRRIHKKLKQDAGMIMLEIV